jgi:hypothetical protein
MFCAPSRKGCSARTRPSACYYGYHQLLQERSLNSSPLLPGLNFNHQHARDNGLALAAAACALRPHCGGYAYATNGRTKTRLHHWRRSRRSLRCRTARAERCQGHGVRQPRRSWRQVPSLVRRAVSVAQQNVGSAEDAADHPLRGIFHPLGAAFFSNASYPETLKVLNQTDVAIEPFALAGNRQMFRYNYTDGVIEVNPSPAPQFLAAVSSEIPRYVQLWNQRFRNISTTNYKVRQLCNVARNRAANARIERRTRRIHCSWRRVVPQE